MTQKTNNFLTGIRHPDYQRDEISWDTYRLIYNGGDEFVTRCLKRFSARETQEDFNTRKYITPIPSFAKAAVNDIRNGIFQRLRDVARREGSTSYMQAAAGEIGGVDNKGSSMQSFLGIDALTELLVMGRVGVYTDMPALSGFQTMADEGKVRPYCYMYPVEDILSWAVSKPEEPGEFTAVLLRDVGINYNQGFTTDAKLPSGGYVRYRFIWINPATGKVNMKLFDPEDNRLNFDGSIIAADTPPIELDLDRIPFTMLSIGGSLLKDVYKHQVALLNLGSSDVSYALKANFPFYVEQRDTRDVGNHLKQSIDDDGTSNTSDNSEPGMAMQAGVSHGRTYDMKADAPSFIHPSPEPLLASLKLQEKLEDGIRKLVNLAVQNQTGQRTKSAEAMKLSDQGLEAGLSFIGLVLESAERQIASHWASYESRDPDKRQIATIKYPDRYSLKTDKNRIEEAKDLADLMFTVPGKTVKQELSKNIVTTLLTGKVNTTTIDVIYKEIEEANYATSDPEVILRANESGVCGDQTASEALGFDEDEFEKAREDHALRAARILEAQGGMEGAGASARGVEDLDDDTNSGGKERKAANETTLKDDPVPPTRGDGKDLKKGEKK
jgi:hypothetical protein